MGPSAGLVWPNKSINYHSQGEKRRNKSWKVKSNYAGTKRRVEMSKQGLNNHQQSNWKKEKSTLGKSKSKNQEE